MSRLFMKDKERRLVAVPIATENLIEMLREGYHWNYEYKCITGVPIDAVMVTDYFDQMSQRAMVVFYHQSFEVVEEGCCIPILKVCYERIPTSGITWRDLVEALQSNVTAWWKRFLSKDK